MGSAELSTEMYHGSKSLSQNTTAIVTTVQQLFKQYFKHIFGFKITLVTERYLNFIVIIIIVITFCKVYHMN